jgi:hypothetical protein
VKRSVGPGNEYDDDTIALILEPPGGARPALQPSAVSAQSKSHEQNVVDVRQCKRVCEFCVFANVSVHVCGCALYSIPQRNSQCTVKTPREEHCGSWVSACACVFVLFLCDLCACLQVHVCGFVRPALYPPTVSAQSNPNWRRCEQATVFFGVSVCVC